MPPELNVEDELCPECEGGGLMDCPECGGTGEEYEEPCEECAGQCTVPCYSCDGSGSTSAAEGGMQDNIVDSDLPACFKCGGSGSFNRRDGSQLECETCHGTGRASPQQDDYDVHASTSYERLHGVKQEGFTFDRFMDDIIIKEGAGLNKKTKTVSDSLQRVRARKHQERPLGRIRYGVK
jgi:DnaJ-class molecular chaperone